jgi:hypothetical protein
LRLHAVFAALLFLNLTAARGDSVQSYELPEFVSVGGLFTNDSGELVVTFTSHDRRDHFWNADKRQDLPNIDPEKIAHDKIEYDAVIARNHLVPLEIGIRSEMTLASGAVVSGGWLDTARNCQWLYHAYVKVRPVNGEERSFAFLIRRPTHRQDLVYNCAGVSGASYLNVGFDDGSPLFYRRPGGGFYVAVIGMPYVIGFTDDGATDFVWDNKPIAIMPEYLVAGAYSAMANGKLSPQAAVDSLQAAASASHRP